MAQGFLKSRFHIVLFFVLMIFLFAGAGIAMVFFVDETIGTAFMATSTFILILACVIMLFRDLFKRLDEGEPVKIPEIMGKDGNKIPLIYIANFGGHNSLNPYIMLFQDHLEYKIFLTKRVRYSEIRKIGIRSTIYGSAIVLNPGFFSGQLFVPNKKSLPVLLKFFRLKGIKLSEEAEKITRK